MTTWRKVGCCLATVAGLSFAAQAYEDAYITTTDDSVVFKEVGGRKVYVFTNTAEAATVTFKQAMTLEEALLVGGGGAGGWGGGYGAGGGGGGVVWTNLLRTVAADEGLSVFVGTGGDPYANYVADSTINAERYPHGGNGAPSGLTIGADEFVAYGGGGGGSAYHGQAGTGKLGSSGGFRNPTIFDYRTEGDGLYYTLGQGFVGQIGVDKSAGGGGAGQRFLHQGNGNKASGGEGLVSVITGEAEVYGSGGGGGGCDGWSYDGGPGGTHAGMGGDATKGKSVNGDDGFGGGGGGGGKGGSTGGRGGSGTVVLAFSVGDTTSDPFVITTPRRVPYDANDVAVAPVRVTCGGETLEEGIDYDLFYYNTDITSRAQAFALVEAVGKGDYSGKRATATYEAVRAILVSAEATEAASGTSWATATAFADALARVGSDWEIWMKAGTYVRTSRIDYKGTAAYSFYGGFSGNDDWPDELAEDPYSIWDGNDSGSGFFWFENTTTYQWEFIFDHIHFTHSTGSMLNRREGASLRVRNCKFTDCRSTVRAAQGLHCGSYNARRSFTTCEHCLFANLQRSAVSDSALGGVAIYADKQATIFLDGCTFVSNSIPLDSTLTWNKHKAGAAIFITDSSVLKARRCKFICHRSDMAYNGWGTGGASAVSVNGSCSGSLFENCLFIGNEDTLSQDPKSWPGGALNINASSVSQTVTVHRCTFAYNLHMGLDSAAGLTVEVGHADVSDCIFYGNVVSTRNVAGADLAVKNGSAAVTRSLFAADARTTPGKYFSALDATKLTLVDPLYGDPQFVTPVADFVACLESSAGQTPDCPIAPHYTNFIKTDGAGICALDAHLLSPGVYCDNAGVRHADEDVPTSSAILDDGTNLGCYAGTAEESLLPQINPHIEDVEVTWEGGYSQPRVTFTPGRETGSAYNAKVTVEYRVQGGETYSKTYTGVPSDVPFSALADFCLPPGATYSGSVTVEAGGNSETVEFEGTVDVPYNPSWGKGGGADKVVHVRPGATGRGTGDNWFDALTDFHAALSHLTETRNELWLAGDIKQVTLAPTCSPKADAVVRGGFAGTESDPADRADGTLSTIDGDGDYTPLTLDNAHAITLERLGFMHSRDSGLIKSGAGDIVLLDCSFTANATNMVSVNGRGARLSGSAGVTHAVVSNCVFAGNQYLSTVQNGSACYGFGLYLGNFARAEVVDSLFVTNGVNRASAWPSFNDWNGKETMNGTAIYASSAPIFARSCRFVANLACSANNGNGSGTVVLTGAGGGSVFENCLWLANAEENYTTGGTGSRSKDNLGCLRISLSDWSDTVSISNCTIAYNIAESNYGSVGLSIHKGDVRLVNSIIWGNVVSAGSRGADIYVVSNSSLRASYSLLATNSANYVTIAAPTSDYGTVTWGPGMVYGDPRFVTDAATFLSNVHGGNPAIPRGGSGITFGKSNEVAKVLCAFNVHVKGRHGYKDETTGEVVKYPKMRSPAIDAGDPNVPFPHEARPRGQRINLGFYGNTPWATMSKGGTLIFVK